MFQFQATQRRPWTGKNQFYCTMFPIVYLHFYSICKCFGFGSAWIGIALSVVLYTVGIVSKLSRYCLVCFRLNRWLFGVPALTNIYVFLPDTGKLLTSLTHTVSPIIFGSHTWLWSSLVPPLPLVCLLMGAERRVNNTKHAASCHLPIYSTFCSGSREEGNQY